MAERDDLQAQLIISGLQLSDSIDSLTSSVAGVDGDRAGFPPVLLAPINFEAIYQQRQAEQAQQQAASGAREIPIQ